MTADEIERLFAGPEGYRFARWGRPLAPVVFGVEDATLPVIKGAIEAVARLAGLPMAETDPEIGANLMVFFLRDWDELLAVPGLDRLVGDVPALVGRLGGAGQYRTFRFDEAGAIRASFSFVRMAGGIEEMPADVIALTLAVQAVLLWSDGAFAEWPMLAAGPDGTAFLRPEVAGLIRAAYDPVLPAATSDPSHAMRLAARLAA